MVVGDFAEERDTMIIGAGPGVTSLRFGPRNSAKKSPWWKRNISVVSALTLAVFHQKP